ncbi:hypothetical protein GCM10027452_39690 [Micromonospora halotolerans]
MGTPLGDFVRAKRDSIQPESFGLPDRGRRRSPGLTRAEVATRSGISVEYLTRIEQGRDRNPSHAVLHALADGLSLDAGERHHLRYLAKITGGGCPGHRPPAPPNREVRPTVRETLRLLEPGVAFVTNRLGDVLAHTGGFGLVMGGIGLLDTDEPNLTRFVFTDPRARSVFPDWDQVADERELAPVAGPEFTRRLQRHLPPPQVPLRLDHPAVGELRWHREKLELPSTDAQELVVLLPADEATAQAVEGLRHRRHGTLRAVG